MAVWRFVNLNVKEAQLLADLTGVLNDLQATVSICDLLMNELQKSQPEWRLLDALSAAALVRYARSFTKGVRAKVPVAALSCLCPDLLKFHKWFIDLRDKYVAHSVNAFEENQVVAYLVPAERGPKGVASISVQQTRLASLGGSDIKKLKEICGGLQIYISKLVEEERSKVLELAKKIPVDQLYTQIDSPVHIATMKDVDKSRKRY
jgi:hypothetical protein